MRWKCSKTAGSGRKATPRVKSVGLLAGFFWVCVTGGVTAGPLQAERLATANTNTKSHPVRMKQDRDSFELENGFVCVRVDKRTGFLRSLLYCGLELLATPENSPDSGGGLGGYWSQVGRIQPGPMRTNRVVVDPHASDGELADVMVGFVNDTASPMGAVDIEIHYAVVRGIAGVYTYAVWRHLPGYPPFSVGEARFCAKLNPELFDYMTIDEARQGLMPLGRDWDAGETLNLKEARRMTTGLFRNKAEHKYDYSAVLYQTRVYGWSSSARQLGLWLINPSTEYIGGGPTKLELTAHLDCNPGGLPTLLNMWLGSHYGGTGFAVNTNEHWQKLIGPFLLYCNRAPTHREMWTDARRRAQTESGLWPYTWVEHPLYPQASSRGTVSGRVLIKDPLDSKLRPSNIWVGLTAPNYTNPVLQFPQGTRRRAGSQTPQPPQTSDTNVAARPFRAFPPELDWQRDAKFYQYWTPAGADGRFKLRHVRPGTYWLRVIADGVPGEYVLTNVVVLQGQHLKLGRLLWQPLRYGRTLWQIGVPDRTATEFRHGNHYWQWGLYNRYPSEFPNDVRFVVGKDDWRWAWNYVQPPRAKPQPTELLSEDDEPNFAFDPPIDISSTNAANALDTSWEIIFTLENTESGEVVLRLGFCGTQAGCNVRVSVNGVTVGETGPLPPTSSMQRDSARAFSLEKIIRFDTALLTRGTNMIRLTSTARSWSQGVSYDFVRLELAEPKPAPPEASP